MESANSSSGSKYEKGATVTLILISVLIFISFAGIWQNHDVIVSDLIPDRVVYEHLDRPLMNHGIFLSFFLVISVLLRAFKKIKAAFILDIVNIIGASLITDLFY